MADVVAEHDRVLSVAHDVVVASKEIGEPVTERTHGYTSTEMRQALDAWPDVGRSCDRPRGYVGVDRARRGCARSARTTVSKPW